VLALGQHTQRRQRILWETIDGHENAHNVRLP
jgi:hypothetical protein